MDLSDGELVDLLRSWLPGRRWFAAKDLAIREARILSRWPVPGVDDALHVIVGVQSAAGGWQVYQTPVALREGPPDAVIGVTRAGTAIDALYDEQVVSALLDRCGKAAHLDPATTPAAPETQWLRTQPTSAGHRVLSGEQSNTSVVIGEATLVKFFRILTPGINPDVEVHAELSELGSTAVAGIRGWINGGWSAPSGESVHGHLAMISEFFPDARDGWVLARQHAADGVAFDSQAEALGRATARVHDELASVFPTAVIEAADVAGLADRLQRRLSAAGEVVAELAPLLPRLQARIARIREIPQLTVQRVHGDLHLAQVVHTSGGWRVLDFEGEPGGDLASRRVLEHRSRDIAGMMRSFAYAAWQPDGDRSRAAAWTQGCATAFRSGYRQEAGLAAIDGPLLDAYLIDKAAYEAMYEQRNRPDWLEIPMTGLRDLAR